jgi:hypothetical protein
MNCFLNGKYRELEFSAEKGLRNGFVKISIITTGTNIASLILALIYK